MKPLIRLPGSQTIRGGPEITSEDIFCRGPPTEPIILKKMMIVVLMVWMMYVMIMIIEPI